MDIVGKMIGKYVIKRKLDQGGMAEVFLGFDTNLEKEVAIKFIRSEMFPPAQLEMIYQRFRREAKALAVLNHPNIIQIIDHGDYDGNPYLVIPYLPGGTLKDKLVGPMKWQTAFKFLLPIIDAVSTAHRMGILHRDIKPSNILFYSNGTPVLTDFGIAKVLDQPGATISNTLAVTGTPNYMAPEQWEGKAEYRSDQYSIGVMLYQMITGQVPFSADNQVAIMAKVLTDPLPPASSIIPDLPKAVDTMINKMTDKKAIDRYSDLDKIKDLMDSLLTASVSEPKKVQKSKPTRTDNDTSQNNEPAKKKKPQWISNGLIVFLIAVLGTTIAIQSGLSSGVGKVDTTTVAQNTDAPPTEVVVSSTSTSVAEFPFIPTGLKVDKSGKDHIILIWDDVSNEDNYALYDWNGSKWTVLSNEINKDDTSFIVNGLNCGTTYFFEVKAVNQYGTSDSAGYIETQTLDCATTVVNQPSPSPITKTGGDTLTTGLEMCTTDPSDMCVYGFAPQESMLFVTIRSGKASIVVEKIELTIDEKIFKCEKVALYPDRVYCSGDPVIGLQRIELFDQEGNILYAGDFNIPKYEPPLPVKKTGNDKTKY